MWESLVPLKAATRLLVPYFLHQAHPLEDYCVVHTSCQGEDVGKQA